MNRNKYAAEDELKNPEKALVHEDLKEDIERYDKMVHDLRKKLAELQEYLPPMDQDAYLDGEYKM